MNVPHNNVKVTILMDRFRIVGEMELYPGARITDVLNESTTQFLTIAGAEIFNVADGKLVHKTDPLIINKNEIRFFYTS